MLLLGVAFGPVATIDPVGASVPDESSAAAQNEGPGNTVVTVTAHGSVALQISCVNNSLEVTGGRTSVDNASCDGTDLVVAPKGAGVVTFTAGATASATFNSVELIAGEGDQTSDAIQSGDEGLIVEGELSAKDVVIGGTAVIVGGSIDAANIALGASSSVVVLEGAALRAPGGTVAIDGGSVGYVQHAGSIVDVSTDADAESGTDGEIVVSAANVSMAGSMATSGSSGAISLLSASDGVTLVSGTITANNPAASGNGGGVRILGGSVALIGPSELGAGARIEANGPSGGGSILVGGDRAGQGPVPTSTETVVAHDVVLDASALTNGDGGTVVVWSDTDTLFYGQAWARGAGMGRGGFVELSGKITIDNQGETDISGPGGHGEVLLDPLYFTVLPAGALSHLTAIDEADAVATKASPLPALQTVELVGEVFCELVGLSSSCRPTQAPYLDSYQNLYGSKNTIVTLLAKIPQLKPIEPRSWFTFLSTPTLEGFTGNIRAQGIFGVQILPGAPGSLGFISSGLSDTGLDLVHQGPGEKVEFETFFSVVTMGRITLGGGDLTLKAGEPFTLDSIEDIIRGYAPGGTAVLDPNFLHGLDFMQLAETAVTNSFSNNPNEQNMLETIALVDLLSGGQVPAIASYIPGVVASPIGASNLVATINLLEYLGVPVPGWMKSVATTMAEIESWSEYLPGGVDVFEAALGGITVPGFPGVPGIVTPRFCAGTESGGRCYVLGLAPHGGTPGVVTPRTCTGVASGGDCWVTPPVPASSGWHGTCPFCTYWYNPEIPGVRGTWVPATCATVWVGGTCYSIPPFAGVELGYTPAVCAGVWHGGGCYTIPPFDAFGIPGVCDIDPANIPCSTTEVFTKGIRPVLLNALLDFLPGNLNDKIGPSPTSLVIPNFSITNVLPALLYADSQITSSAGTINLINSSLLGTVLLGDVVTGSTVNVEVPRGAVINRRLDPSLVLGVLGLANVPTGTRGNGTLVANKLVIDAKTAVAEANAPLTVRQLSSSGLDATIDTNEGGVHLRADQPLTMRGSITSSSGATFEAASTVNVSGLTIEIGETWVLEYLLSGGDLDMRAPTVAHSIQVTGGDLNDTVRLAPYPLIPIAVNAGGGMDTLVFDDGGGTYQQTTARTISVGGMQPITFANVERIENLRPWAQSVVGSNTVLEGSAYNANVSFIDWGADSWNIVVDWGDGSTDTFVRTRTASEADTATIVAAIQHHYADNGTYEISVKVVDALDGGNETVTTSTTVVNAAPTIDAGLNQDLAFEGDTIVLDPATFNDPGTGDTHTATIDWGDGSPVASATVNETPVTPGSATGLDGTITASHNYADNGVYTVEICVTDDEGANDCDTFTVTARNAAPVVAAGADQLTVAEGDLVSLDPSSFMDPGTADTHTATVTWGDGTPADIGLVTETPTGPPGSAAGATGTVAGSHVYANNGSYLVEVCVTDDDVETDCDSLTVQTTNVAPAVDAGGDLTVAEGSTIALDAAAFTDRGTLDTHTATVDWGDGSAVASVAVTEAPFGPPGDLAGASGTLAASHVYADNGIYTVTVCVTDSDAGQSCDTTSATVSNVLPVTVASSDQQVTEGDTVTLPAQVFSDAGTLDTHTASITWGDGTPPEQGTVTETPTGPPGALTPATGTATFGTHVYADNGTYTVRVCVTDDDEGSHCDRITITVDNAAPTIVVLVEETELEGATVELLPSTFTDAGTADTHTATVDWGDGTPPRPAFITEFPTGPPGSSTASEGTITDGHQYADDGVYIVQVCVSDDDGATACGTDAVTIENAAPVLTVDEPREVAEGDLVSLITTTFSDAGTADRHTATVDWGDGSARVAATVDEQPYGNNGPQDVVDAATGDLISGTDLGTLPTDLDDALDATPPVYIGMSGTISATHVYSDNGTYVVTICTSDDTVEVCDTFTVTVTNALPAVTAALGGGSAEGEIIDLGITQLTDPGTADTHTATVNWGDGTGTTVATVVERPTGPTGSVLGMAGQIGASHVYANDGRYLVEVCVRDDDQPAESASICDTTLATIGDRPAVVNAGTDNTIDEGQELQLEAGSFVDPGTGDQHNATVFWGDGSSTAASVNQPPPSILGSTAGAPGVITSPAHMYVDDGTYTLVMCADDRALLPTAASALTPTPAHCDTAQVTVNNLDPSVDALSMLLSTDEGSPLDLGAIRFGDPGPADELSVTVDYGDGVSTDGEELSSETAPGLPLQGTHMLGDHIFVDDGSYGVNVCVTDDDGGQACDTVGVTVNNVAPTLTLANGTSQGDEGDTLTLPLLSIDDPGSDDRFEITVDWGDGSTPDIVSATGSMVDDLDHVYADNGSYTATICVDDGTDSVCDDVAITVDNVAPIFSLANTDEGGTEASETGRASSLGPIAIADGGSLDSHTATVNWGDGSATEVLGLSAFAAQDGAVLLTLPEHVWNDAGTYEVELCVTDSDGATTCQTIMHEVRNPSSFWSGAGFWFAAGLLTITLFGLGFSINARLGLVGVRKYA